MAVNELVAELRREGGTTRQLLDRVPEDQLSWTPHERSRTLGQLAFHIAAIPRGIADMLDSDEAAPPDVPPIAAKSRTQLLEIHDESIERAAAALEKWGEERLRAMWRMVAGGQVLMELPRIAMVRMLMMNHLYHHRGQLTVYLRLLQVPVPPVYGPSADENPFA